MTRKEVYEICKCYPFDPEAVWCAVDLYEFSNPNLTREQLEARMAWCIQNAVDFSLAPTL